MEYAIFGTKKEAKYLFEEIRDNQLGTVVAFLDNSVDRQGEFIDGISIISLEKFINLYGVESVMVLVAARGSYSRLSIINQLKTNNVENIGVFKFSYCDYKQKICDVREAIIDISSIDKPFMPYLEYNVTDSCNLKCKGCTHFSNLLSDNEFADCLEFKSDIEKLSEKVYIGQLRLLGGEPLLHPDLSEFVSVARNCLPNSDIFIVSNGLLIPKVDERVLLSLRENNVGFHISRYYPTDKLCDVIEEKLSSLGVNYYMESDVIKQFGRCLSMKGNSDVNLSQQACISLGCRFMKSGKVYKCPFDGLISLFTDYYNIENVPKSCGIDVYDDSTDWEYELNKLFKEPIDMCKYCAETCEMYDWKVNVNPSIEDWIVFE